MTDQGFPVGGSPTPLEGGADVRHGHFSAKRYATTQELSPIGGGDPPLVQSALFIIMSQGVMRNYKLTAVVKVLANKLFLPTLSNQCG